MNAFLCLIHYLYNLRWLLGRYLEAEDNTRAEQILTVGHHHVTLGLPVELPAVPQSIVVFIADVDASKEVVGVTATRSTDAQVAVVVTTSHHARLVGDAYTPCVVTVPEGLRADMIT